MYAMVCVFIGDTDVQESELKLAIEMVQERLAPLDSRVVTHPYMIKFVGDHLIREEQRVTGYPANHDLSSGTDRRHHDQSGENVEGGSGT